MLIGACNPMQRPTCPCRSDADWCLQNGTPAFSFYSILVYRPSYFEQYPAADRSGVDPGRQADSCHAHQMMLDPSEQYVGMDVRDVRAD